MRERGDLLFPRFFSLARWHIPILEARLVSGGSPSGHNFDESPKTPTKGSNLISRKIRINSFRTFGPFNRRKSFQAVLTFSLQNP